MPSVQVSKAVSSNLKHSFGSAWMPVPVMARRLSPTPAGSTRSRVPESGPWVVGAKRTVTITLSPPASVFFHGERSAVTLAGVPVSVASVTGSWFEPELVSVRVSSFISPT